MPDPNDYTVGWICALHTEYLAAQLCLDEQHKDVSIAASTADNNHYTRGKIGDHNVVMTVLPLGEYGTTSAASVAKDMMRSFPNIRIGLMVGIGGGIPTKHDIRLGDVVVGVPEDGRSSVFHYEFGKTIQGQNFRPTAVLNQPPRVLLTAINGLRSQYMWKGHQIQQSINEVLAKEPRLRQDYSRPELATDQLFKPHLVHEDVCGQGRECVHNKLNLVPRRDRTESEDSPAIHYGTIASADKLIKDAIMRDKLAEEKDVLCFEMEAAGLMNHFPCLVIRGICDYSDSHKNKQWQGYAALAAAFYAKDLLNQIHPSQAIEQKRVAELIASVHEGVSRTEKKVSYVQSRLERQEDHEVLNWFCSFDHMGQLQGILDRRTAKTGEWFLRSQEFKAWLNGTHQTLFCPGIPGAGKTFITSIVVDYLHRMFQDDNSVGIAFAFLNHEEVLPVTDLLALLLKQLIPEPVPTMVADVYRYHQRRDRPSPDQALSTLYKLVTSYSKTFIVIDALDESPVSNRQRILTELFKIQDAAAVNLLVTGRSISEIVETFRERQSMLYAIRARDEDVHRFITNELEMFEGCIAETPELKEQVADSLTKATKGMFLLAYLHIQPLREASRISGVRNTLETLPTGSADYHEAYDNIMTRINKQSTQRRDLAIQVLSWITESKRPIRLAELRHALAVTDGSLDVDEENIPSNREIILACVGLVSIDNARDTVRLVHYTTAEYFQERSMSWFPDANRYIATVSINYLTFEIFSTPIAGNWEEYNTRLRTNCLYEYAGLYWGDHARQAYPQVKHLVTRLLQSGPKLLNSVHVLDASAPPFRLVRSPDGVTGLHVAAYFGIVEQFGELIKEGESIDVVDGYGRTPLHWAAKNGQRHAAELLHSQALDVNALDSQKENPLHYSARQGHGDLVELLINLGSQVEARNSAGETALLVAACSVNIEALQGLLTHGADPNAVDRMDRNALHLVITASKTNSATAVKLLLSYGVGFGLCDEDNMTPLHYAVAEGSNEIIDLLLEAGANINLGVQRNSFSGSPVSVCRNAAVPAAPNQDIGDGIGLTPLHFAACSGHSRMTQYLLERGANPNACCCNGDTPLHIAIRGGLFNPRINGTSAPYTLLSDDAWTNGKWHIELAYDAIDDYESEEAVGITRYVEEERLAVITALLDSPIIDLSIHNIHHDYPIHLVKYGSDTAAVVVPKLLDLGADIFARNHKGQTPLHLACKAGALDVVKDLLNRGCSISTPDHDGLTALHLAIRESRWATVQAIFSMDEEHARAYCVGIDAQGRTLLHHLLQADYIHTEMVDLLLRYGASPSCIDNAGQSPLSTYIGSFKLGSRTTTCQLLLKNGDNPLWASRTGETLAHLAVRQYNAEPEVLQALSDYGLDLSIKDSSGKGILHHGAIGGSLTIEILTFLHERNLLDFHAKDADGKTPLDYAVAEAKKKRHPDLLHGSRWKDALKILQTLVDMESAE